MKVLNSKEEDSKLAMDMLQYQQVKDKIKAETDDARRESLK